MSALGFIFTLLISTSSFADKWMAPTSFEKNSTDGQVKVSVETPVKDEKFATAKVSKKAKDGKWKQVCAGALQNKARPVSVYISEDAEYLVTVDDWQSAGYAHALSIYRCEKGLVLVKDFSLDELLKPSEIQANAQQTISSRFWTEGASFSFKRQEFVILLKSETIVHVALKDGSVVRSNSK